MRRVHTQMGLRVRAVRRALDMTQCELARRCGISKSFLCEVEKGGEVSTTNIVAIAKALGESLDYLVLGETVEA